MPQKGALTAPPVGDFDTATLWTTETKQSTTAKLLALRNSGLLEGCFAVAKSVEDDQRGSVQIEVSQKVRMFQRIKTVAG